MTPGRNSGISAETLAARYEIRIYPALFIALVLGVWCAWLSASFILDETATYWTIAGGFGEIIPRAARFTQSIAYCFIERSVMALSGGSEMAMRLPSIASTIASAYFIFRIGARLLDSKAGLLAALLWALMPAVTLEATLARPYMIGVCVLTGSFLALMRWIEKPAISRWILWMALAAIPAYFNYFFVFALPHQMLYLLYRRAQSKGIPLWQVVASPFGIGLLAAPLVVPILQAWSTRSIHVYLQRPGPTELVSEFLPYALAFGLLAAVSLHLLFPVAVKYRRSSAGSLLVAAGWAAIPVLISFAISRLTTTEIFVTRYMMAATPGLALYFAFLIRGFEPASMRLAIVGVTALFAVAGFGPEPDFWHNHRHGDFRAASLFVSRQTSPDLPLYAFSRFTEANFLPFPVSDSDKGFLLAFLGRYPPGRPAMLLPSAIYDGSRAYAERFLADVRAARKPFLLYTGNPEDTPLWFVHEMSQSHREVWLYNRGDVGIVEYLPR